MLGVEHFVLDAALFKSDDIRSLFSIDTVPTSTGRPRRSISLILLREWTPFFGRLWLEIRSRRVLFEIAPNFSVSSLSSKMSHLLIRSISSAMAINFSRSVR